MFGVGMWVRRSWRWMVPLTLLTQVVSFMNYHSGPDDRAIPWSGDWSWMLSAWSGSTLPLSPVAAAGAAYLLIRQMPRGVRQLTAPLRRHVRPALDIAMAVWLQAVGAQLITLIGGAAICFAADADPSGLTLPWQALTGPAALLAAVLAAVAVAAAVDSPWTVPAVALGMYFCHRIFYWKGYPELFTLEAATGAVEGARPIPEHLMASIGLNLAVALAAVAVLVIVSAAPGLRSRLAMGIAVAALATAVLIVLPWMLAGTLDTYEYLQ